MDYTYCAVCLGILAMAAFVVTNFVRNMRRPRVMPVNAPSDLRQHVGHDLSELGGLSQSNHFGAIVHNEVRNHVA